MAFFQRLAHADRLRFMLNKSRLQEDCLYGADRVNVVGRRPGSRIKRSPGYGRQYHHRYLVRRAGGPRSRLAADSQRVRLLPAGLLPALALAARDRRYHFSQGSAEHSDVLFAVQWPAAKRILLPGVFVYHLESEPARIGTNWNGRVTKPFTK